MISKEKEEMLNHYNAGLAAYKARNWDEAIKAFEMALKVEPKDGPSKEYLKRSSHFKENPPPDDWDGVFIMSTK